MEKQLNSVNKAILVLTTEYSKTVSPNAVCVTNVISELCLKDPSLGVVYLVPKRTNENEIENKEGVFIYRYRRSLIEDCIDLSKKIHNKGIQTVVLKLLYSIWRVMLLINVKRYPQFCKEKEIRALKLLKELLSKYEFILAILTYNPIESVACARVIKQESKETKIVAYMLDSISNKGAGRIVSKEFGARRGKEWEDVFFDNSDLILLPQSHFHHYAQPDYSKYSMKFVEVDYPLMCNPVLSDNNSKEQKETITCLYAGSLDYDLRNPQKMLEIMSQIGRITLLLYTSGNCDNIIRRYIPKSKCSIKLYGTVSREEIIKKENDSSILVSIGNNNTDMVPSKLFELMATGKPIIHFINSENDSCLPYLRQYRNSLVVDSNTDIEKVKHFIFDNDRTAISFEELSSTFEKNTPRYTANQIWSFCNDNKCDSPCL